MKFKQNSRRPAAEYEPELVRYWKEHKTFEKSVEQRPATNAYVFYDGPPFITGVPHHGTLLASVVKDAVPRYQAMKGRRVERVWGWDCHGLPAEVFTEQKLGIHDRRDIGTKVSLEDYINTCRANMVQVGSEFGRPLNRDLLVRRPERHPAMQIVLPEVGDVGLLLTSRVNGHAVADARTFVIGAHGFQSGPENNSRRARSRHMRTCLPRCRAAFANRPLASQS